MFRVATRPKGIANEPVSGMTEKAMHTIARLALCPTTTAARTLTTAPTKMHGAYTKRGRIVVFTRSPMITKEEISCRTDLYWPASLNAA